MIAYWIGPWLGVVFADRVLDRSTTTDLTTFISTRHVNLAGPVAMAASIPLFSNQSLYAGLVPTAVPAAGDLTFEVGFVLAVVLYTALRPVFARRAAATA